MIIKEFILSIKINKKPANTINIIGIILIPIIAIYITILLYILNKNDINYQESIKYYKRMIILVENNHNDIDKINNLFKNSVQNLNELLSLYPEDNKFNTDLIRLKKALVIIKKNTFTLKEKNNLIKEYKKQIYFKKLLKNLNFIKIYTNNNMNNLYYLILKAKKESNDTLNKIDSAISDSIKLSLELIDITKSHKNLNTTTDKLLKKTKNIIKNYKILKKIAKNLENNIYESINYNTNKNFIYNNINIFDNKLKKFSFY